MRFITRPRQLASTAVITALALGGVVGMTGTAQAETASASYTCQTLAGPFEIPVGLDAAQLTGTLPTGLTVPAGVSTITGAATLPATLISTLQFLLSGLGQVGASISDFALTVGNVPVAIDNMIATPVALGSGDLTLPASGTVGSFTVPAPGVYDVALPNSFSLTPLTDLLNVTLPGSSCTLGDGVDAVVGQLTVVKQTSTTSAKVKRSGKKYRATVAVVRQLGSAATGKVTARVGKRKLVKTLTSKGTAVFSLPRSAKGSTIKLRYAGDKLTSASKGSAKLR